MTGPRFESPMERALRQAAERGDFDNLPGAGKPLPRDDPRDEMWWVRQYAQREEVPGSAFLPMSLQLRKEAETLPAKVARYRGEDAVRREVADLNTRIRDEIRMPTSPIPLAMAPLDVEEIVRDWRDRADAHHPHPGSEPPGPASRLPWWRRILRRGSAPR